MFPLKSISLSTKACSASCSLGVKVKIQFISNFGKNTTTGRALYKTKAQTTHPLYTKSALWG